METINLFIQLFGIFFLTAEALAAILFLMDAGDGGKIGFNMVSLTGGSMSVAFVLATLVTAMA